MGGLSDAVAGAGLTAWAEAALVLFFGVFVGILVYVLWKRRDRWDRARYLPLGDGPARTGSSEETSDG